MTTLSQSIREITAKQPSALKVFERFSIDACSEADKSLKEVCADLQLSGEQVLEKLTELERSESGQTEFDPAGLPLTQIIQHIVRTHHHRIRCDLPALVRMAQRIAESSGEHAPELNGIRSLVEQFQRDMLAHIQKEEKVLFPFIAQMEEDSALVYFAKGACFQELSHPVFMMVQEHEAASRILAELRQRTHNFEAPDWACPTHLALLGGLRTFAEDLKQHVHLENDVLFPRAIYLEADLREAA